MPERLQCLSLFVAVELALFLPGRQPQMVRHGQRGLAAEAAPVLVVGYRTVANVLSMGLEQVAFLPIQDSHVEGFVIPWPCQI